MLGRILDEAAARGNSSNSATKNIDPLQAPYPTGEGSALLSRPSQTYGAHQPLQQNDTGSDDEDDEEETLEDAETTDLDNDTTSFSSCWNACRTCLRVVADVENLWDSPQQPHNVVGGDGRYPDPATQRHKNWIVAFWFVALATAYAGERSSFKFLVDQAGPFRLFSVEMVTSVHSVLLGMGLFGSFVAYKKRQRQSSTQQSSAHLHTAFDLPLGVPIVDVGLMALLDVLSLMLVFLTGIYVSPTLTVILVQFTIPLTAFLSQFVHPDGRFACCRPTTPRSASADSASPALSSPDSRASNPNAPPSGRHHRRDHSGSNYSSVDSPMDDTTNLRRRQNQPGEPLAGCAGLATEHLWGCVLIFMACVFALIPSYYTIIDPQFFLYADEIPLRVAYSSFLFLSASVPAAASQLYKEHVFTQYKQPVNATKLNLLLSVFEFIFASVLAPLVFTLQGIGSTPTDVWTTVYPSSSFSDNFVDGLLCFFWQLDEDEQQTKYPENAQCDWLLGLTLLHACCIILVGVAVDKIVSVGATKVTHRGISAGIILAVSCMAVYDFHIPNFNYGPFVDALNLFCLVLLILGSEVYHRTSLPADATFETVYPSLDNIYDEE